MKKNLIKDKSFEFAKSIIKLYKALVEKREYILSKQLLRSGTSIGANVFESEAAQSRKDFISKMSIASKEARESRYWLLLIKETDLVEIDVSSELKEIEHIINIISKIVKTTSIDI